MINNRSRLHHAALTSVQIRSRRRWADARQGPGPFAACEHLGRRIKSRAGANHFRQ